MIPLVVTNWLVNNGFGDVVSTKTVGGGCVNKCLVITTSSYRTLFLKTNSQCPKDMFEREAEGLEELRIGKGPRVPKTYLYEDDFILLEDVKPSAPQENYWEKFGVQLATLHNQVNPRFGFYHNNYIGSTAQINNWMDDGYRFFAEQRLLYQAELAYKKGLMTVDDLKKLEHLANCLPMLIPSQKASLIHGDLWSGNLIPDLFGNPTLIDPATHYGWAEAELAMTSLFGGFPESFYFSYEEVHPLEPGYHTRFRVYNLYQLLNHVNLFGVDYYHQVKEILHYFSERKI